MTERRRLGNSDLEITPLGIGAWAMGGPGWQFSWGEQNDKDSVEAIHAAVDAGINWIDTAAVYGLGHSEQVVARALEGISNKPYIFTKCERRWDKKGKIFASLKAESVRKECEESLRRLKIERIDLYQVHWPEPDLDLEEGWAEMARLKETGKVRWIGVSNFNVEQMKRAMKIAPIASLQPPYSLLERKAEPEILPFAEQHGIGVIVYSPMRAGLLTGKMTTERVRDFPADDWRRRDKDFQEPLLSRNLQLVALLQTLAKRHGRTPGEVALAWTLNYPAVTGAIVGLRKRSQVAGVIGALSFRLTLSEVAEIEEYWKQLQQGSAAVSA